jgi:energy-coupling factor transporter ATP-binding protein EcfA2
MVGKQDVQGSKWHRWDPHIHAPGTVREDEFRGDWNGYLSAIEMSDPPIRALGITDYCLLDTYEAVADHWKSGRLPNVDLIFPNVELRYDVGVPKGSAVNVHVLVSPDDPDHVAKLKRFLSTLTFTVDGREFRCERNDLIELGKKHEPSTASNDAAALAAGVNQFKVNREQLHLKCRQDPWAKENVLLAVPGSSRDGTGALQSDTAMAAIRWDIERTADVILSGQENQRLFWLGQGSVTGDDFVSRYGRPKPCIHGSDAHGLDRVGKPDGERFTWIKGDVTFESLRQICFEPETRVSIGPAPPTGALPSQVVASVNVTNAPWFKNGSVSINSGLVGIIGARGSGKTALADLIAAGAYALYGHLSDKSFVQRAREHLHESSAQLRWEDGEKSSCDLKSVEYADLSEDPRIQYLSQQFVDKLCSSEGLAESLLAEVKRVVFDAHAPEDRMGATSFEELLEIRTSRARSMRANHEIALAETIESLVQEWQQLAVIKPLKHRRDELVKAIERDKVERARFIGNGSDERAKQMDALSRATEAVRLLIQAEHRRVQALMGLRDEVVDVRKNKSPFRLNQLRQSFAEAALAPEEWNAFTLVFVGPVDEILNSRIKDVEQRVRRLTGPMPGEPTLVAGGVVPAQSYIPTDARLEEQTLTLLENESGRLRALIGIDERNANAVRRLTEKIAKDENALAHLNRDVAAAEAAPERMNVLNKTRQECYAGIFDGIKAEEAQLESLYDPLRKRLARERGALSKLNFSVRRRVEVNQWAQRGEELLDLRKSGPFQGHGTLLEKARRELLPAWLRGSSSQVAEALAAFREAHEKELIGQSKVDRKDAGAFRKWWGNVAAWLYSTDHIDVTYSIQYEGADIEQLSPGTRGIVLLLLYLAIDLNDDRPLIIDQPEENLDPKSIHDELVVHFRLAKQRRQIIVVTHNANIVVNADADQVIVATCGPHRSDQLPEIKYVSGGLENPDIRSRVCDILEGGEAAFRERAKRLRIRTES